MKNKLLTTLLELQHHARIIAEIYKDATDKVGKGIYADARAEHTAYRWAIIKTYGDQKAKKILENFSK